MEKKKKQEQGRNMKRIQTIFDKQAVTMRRSLGDGSRML